jgi:RimJ/RimL family protein N-acetyltransferase
MAAIEQKTITLSGDKSVVVRTPTPVDARALRDFQLKVFADSEYMIHRPEEYQRSVRDERRTLKAKYQSPNQLYLVAESGGNLMALLTSRVDPRHRVSHTVQLGLAVERAWRGQRLGEALLRLFIGWAQGVDSLKRIELNVTEGNAPAQKLYKRLGFGEEGRRRRAICFGGDDYRDDIIMCRHLVREIEPLPDEAALELESEDGPDEP